MSHRFLLGATAGFALALAVVIATAAPWLVGVLAGYGLALLGGLIGEASAR